MNKKTISILIIIIIVVGGASIYYFKNQKPTSGSAPTTNNEGSESIGDLSSYYTIKQLNATDKTIKSISLTADNFPPLDGATASQPIRSLIACEAFNGRCSWYETEAREMFLYPYFYNSDLSNEEQNTITKKIEKNSKTHDAYLNLIQSKIDLILVSTKPSDDGVEPNPENIASEKYPHIFNIYAVTRADEPKNSPSYQIKEWLTSQEGQALIVKAGYVGLGN